MGCRVGSGVGSGVGAGEGTSVGIGEGSCSKSFETFNTCKPKKKRKMHATKGNMLTLVGKGDGIKLGAGVGLGDGGGVGACAHER